MIGQTISHYRILSKLGEGGMGVVYRAEDLTLGRTVALKFLPPDSVAREEDRARLVHEARAAAALLHPNICPIHEIAEAEGRTFISMACIEGRSLKDRIAEGPMPLDEALSIARQIGDALAAAHTKGIIHRDIKPANVMLTPEGRPMLMDFGLAKVSGATKLTRTGTTMGTVAYMSPEQVQGREVDHRSDIWALGVVLYEMVSGRMPFGADYEAALLYSILNEDPVPLAGEGSDVPAGLDGIIAKALAKDPVRRYQKAEEIVADLDALGRDSEALPAGKAVPAKGLKRVWRRARTWQRATAVAMLLALAAVGTTLMIHSRSQAPEAGEYTLAVMDFNDTTGDPEQLLSSQLGELVNTGLIEAFIEADVIRVINTGLLHDLRRRLYGQMRGAINESQAFELVRKVEATLYLVATIGQSGSGKVVSWQLVDARSRTNVGGGVAEGLEPAEIANQIIAKAIPKISRACGIKETVAPASVESMTSDNPRAYRHYAAGLLASEEGRREDAIAEFERAVTLDSAFALAYYQLGREYGAYFSGKNREYFGKAWNFRARLGVKDRMRLDATRAGSPMRAIAVLREIRKRWPDDKQALIDLRNLVGSYFYCVEALRISEEGLRYYPDDSVIGGLFYLDLLVHLGRSGDALKRARSYSLGHPEEPIAWSNLGDMFLASGMPDSAEAAYGRAVKLDPRLDPDDEYGIIVAFCRGDLAGATVAAERLVSRKNIDPDKRRARTIVSHQLPPCLAGLYIEAGRYREMREATRQYWDPESMRSQLTNQIHTRLLVAMSEWREIVDIYAERERAAKEDTTLEDLYPRDLGKAWAELGDAGKARERAAWLRKVEPEGGGRVVHDANEIDARACLAARDPKMALKFLDDMRKNGVPWGGYIDIDYRTTLARAYWMHGRLDKAVEVHKQMLKVYGSHALSHYELGKLYEEMKRPADAKKEYAKFLEMWSEADEDLPQLIDAKKRIAAI